jgi:hypothetical protein
MDRNEETHETGRPLDWSLCITGTAPLRDVLRLDSALLPHLSRGLGLDWDEALGTLGWSYLRLDSQRPKTPSDSVFKLK